MSDYNAEAKNVDYKEKTVFVNVCFYKRHYPAWELERISKKLIDFISKLLRVLNESKWA